MLLVHWAITSIDKHNKMTITRAQIPSQIDPFDAGGDVTSPSTMTYSPELEEEIKMMLQQKIADEQANDPEFQLGKSLGEAKDYDTNKQKYKERLDAVAPAARDSRNIYDLASSLGAGLLSTPNTGPASAFKGLGVGFTEYSKRIKQEDAINNQQKQQVAMQAAQMAMQDEKTADNYLREYGFKQLSAQNKDLKTIDLEWTDPESGEVRQGTLPLSGAFAQTILNNPNVYNARPIPKSALVNIEGDNNQGDGMKEYMKGIGSNISTLEGEWNTAADAGAVTIDQVNSALASANELTQNGEDISKFGLMSLYTMGIKSFLTSVGMGGLINQTDLADQANINQIGVGFAMGLVGQTKGAISNKEMDLFLKATPNLGQTYESFLKMTGYLKKIAQRNQQLNISWKEKRTELLSQKDISVAKIDAALASHKAEFLEENPLFEGGDGGYRDDKSLAWNKENMDKNSEAYKFLIDNVDDDSIKLYKTVSGRHTNIQTRARAEEIRKLTPSALGLLDKFGIPDGAAFEYQDANGVKYYRDAQGLLYNTTPV